MQKTSVFSSFGRLIIRAVIMGVIAVVVFLSSVYAVAFAAEHADEGGKFGEILNKILSSGKWNDSHQTGAIKNSEKVGWKPADQFQQIVGEKQCQPGKCVVGMDSKWEIICD